MTDEENTEHLGDGAYAAYDGFYVWLGANHHTSRLVALEPLAFLALLRYAANIHPQWANMIKEEVSRWDVQQES